MGRIGLAISRRPIPTWSMPSSRPRTTRAAFYRSTDRGETWEKRSDYKTTSPQYYNEIILPIRSDVERVYALDTLLHVTDDGGKTFQRTPRVNRHVDDHALWIDPRDNDYLLVGCDGGVYESFDRGENWRFTANLPIGQFYRVCADNAEPFYYVYGGTQDNSSVGAPSRTIDRIGITNEDWFLTVGGDGYETQVDPTDPHIVYSLWQYGGLVRHDRRSGQTISIKPWEAPGQPPYRWNWDTPLIISPHNHTRLYVAANKLFRSDDRGNSWKTVSGDLTRQLNRDALEVMGKIQSVDAVAKSDSTSVYGNCVALSESPLVEGLLYVGTDDGLIQVSENGGESCRKIETFPGVPELTYVSCVFASQHDADTVFATFDNHKEGDFKPYVLKSTDRGRTWTSIAGDLSAPEFVYSLAEDPVDPALLFVGTEFGVFFTRDGGEQWIKLKGGLPTIAVRDIDIQERASDLVLATFGRGIYVLDDYSPLRTAGKELLSQPATLFAVKDALRYVERSRLQGGNGKGTQGASFYAADNPPFGAVFTYYLKDKLLTAKEKRQQAEKQAAKANEPVAYPTIDELRIELDERPPSVLLIVHDAGGNVLRRIEGPREPGFHRVAWDLRYPAATPIQLEPPADRMPWWQPPSGPLALPGTYNVTLAFEDEGVVMELADAQRFEVVPLKLATFEAEDPAAVLAFQQKVARLQRAVRGASESLDETRKRIAYVRKAVLETPAASVELLTTVQSLQQRSDQLVDTLRGDRTLAKHQEAAPTSINQRVQLVVGSQWNATSPPTQTDRDLYAHASQEFEQALRDLRSLLTDLEALENVLEQSDAPWTPGRVPDWQPE